ncbi:hypothetical protein [Rhodoblastus acidophilus]|nr:hypothetical protein [Rhodoblastus acidophilus]
MVQTGVKGVRAAWADAMEKLGSGPVSDPAPGNKEAWGYNAGQWPGAPAEKLPPGCPVVPLGMDGKVCYVVDSLGQMIDVTTSEWTHNTLISLFAARPNYLYHHWPRFNAQAIKEQGEFVINGLEVKEVHQCLIAAAARRGMFSPRESVRGRGAWLTSRGELIWHAGPALYRVDGKTLKAALPGEVDGMFYPQRPPVTLPWKEPVPPEDSPARQLLEDLRSWSWERPTLDPVLVLGLIGTMFLGAALRWRPHGFLTGDKGVGKTTLQTVIRTVLGPSVISAEDTTRAGIYQIVRQDCLPVAIDELEASAVSRKASEIIDLARVASSGGTISRGGADHEGVQFTLRNAFLFSAINPPPMEPQDRSRLAILNLGKIDKTRIGRTPTVDADVTGRMILRSLMDSWPKFPACLERWKATLFGGGLDSRAQDTYGTLLALANLLIGDAGMVAAGFDVEDHAFVGKMIGHMTSNDRQGDDDNWRQCLAHLLGSTIEAWKSGEKPTVGRVVEDWESGVLSFDAVNERLGLVGMRGREEREDGTPCKTGDAGDKRRLLCVPLSSVGLQKIFQGSKWASGVWGSALKQAPADVVIRDRGNGQNVKINRLTSRCLFVDLVAFDAHVKKEEQA